MDWGAGDAGPSSGRLKVSVMILRDHAFNLIASYAKAYPDILPSHLSAETLALALHRANVEAYRQRYPQFDEKLSPIAVKWMEAVDPADVHEAIDGWRYNVELPAHYDLGRILAVMDQHIGLNLTPPGGLPS